MIVSKEGVLAGDAYTGPRRPRGTTIGYGLPRELAAVRVVAKVGLLVRRHQHRPPNAEVVISASLAAAARSLCPGVADIF
jgi:hypothetical protein